MQKKKKKILLFEISIGVNVSQRLLFLKVNLLSLGFEFGSGLAWCLPGNCCHSATRLAFCTSSSDVHIFLFWQPNCCYQVG